MEAVAGVSAPLAQVSGECLVLIGVTLACLVLGATLFSWNEWL